MTVPTEYDLLVAIRNKLEKSTPGDGSVSLTSIMAALTSIQNSINAVLMNQAPTPEQIPTVASISPNSGTSSGGDLVTVSGTNFTGATGVLVGSVAGRDLKVSSDTKLTFVTPAQPADTLHVTVVDGAGTSGTSDADKFTIS